MLEDLNPEVAPSLSEAASDAALADWKQVLRRDFELWLEELTKLPETTPSGEGTSPDLYSFYEQLAAFSTEYRKANRRTAEAFSQWGDTLARFDGDLRLLREHFARIPAEPENTLPHSYSLALIEILDRMHRLNQAFKSPPAPIWWARDARWRGAWEGQRQGFEILTGHVEALLQKAGITRLEVLNKLFDPQFMIAVATAPDTRVPHQTVIEEIAAGYSQREKVLRVAHVKIALQKPNP